MRSGVALFIHIGKLPHPELAASYVMQAERMMRLRDKHTGPFIAKVYRPVVKSKFLTAPGEIRIDLTEEQWLRGDG